MILSVENIKKTYKGKDVLNDVTFEVFQGDFVTLIGRIGSGKSTIVNIIAGLVKPDKGHIIYKGQFVNHKDRAYVRDIGFLLSGDYLIEEFSTVLYWKSVCKLLNLRRSEAEMRIEYLLGLLNVSDPNKPIGQLSSGNKMLVKFGTMLLGDPKVLILDEPFIHLDIMEVQKIENFLTDFNEDGNTILMTTHFPEPLFKIGKNILVLEDGIIKDNLQVKDYKDYESFKSKLSAYFSDNPSDAYRGDYTNSD